MLRALGTRIPTRGRHAVPAPLGRLGDGSWLPAQGRLSCPPVPPPSLIALAKCKLNTAISVQWGSWGWGGGRINFNEQCCEWMHSQLKMFCLIQPRQFIIILALLYFQYTMTDFSVQMTELSSVQLYIWRKRETTVPSRRGKSTQEACDLRVGILGYRQGSEVRDLWQYNTWSQGSKKALWIGSHQG